MVPKLDTQQIELVGRSLLVSELLRDGIEVAIPERDRGVDLIAYLDLGDSFLARPIQLKAFAGAAFTVDRKYARFPGMLIAYVWNVVDPPNVQSYCLTYGEAVAIAEAMGWTSTRSWAGGEGGKGGLYTSTRPSARLQASLQRHRMEPGDWAKKLQELSSSTLTLSGDPP